ncbi:MAG: PAS domain S-box protein [Bdellovibrionales bacterium]|nr:PAS domain S-box protein [Bdellovibrionales bacterium]
MRKIVLLRLYKVALLGAPLLIGLGAHFLIAVPDQKAAMVRKTMDHLQTATRLKNDRLADWFREREGNSQSISRNSYFLDFARRSARGEAPSNRSAVEANVDAIIEVHGYEAIDIVGPDGELRLSRRKSGDEKTERLLARRVRDLFDQTDSSQVFLLSPNAETSEAKRVSIVQAVSLTSPPLKRGGPLLILRSDLQNAFLPILKEWPYGGRPARSCFRGPDPAADICVDGDRVLIGASVGEPGVPAKDLLIVDEPTPIEGWRISTSLSKQEAWEGYGSTAIRRSLPWMLVAFLAFIWLFRERARATSRLERTENQYQNLVESVDQMYVRLSVDGEVVKVNHAAVRILGYLNADELMNRSRSVGIIADQDERRRIVERLRSEDLVRIPRLEMRRKDGSIAVIQAGVRLVRDEFGIPSFLEGFGNDVTARESYERALVAERNIVRTYLDTVGVAVIVLDPMGKIQLVNPSGCRIFGYELEEIIGENYFERLVPEDTRSDRLLRFRQVIRDEQPIQPVLEYPMIRKDGSERLIRWHNAIVRDASGRGISMLLGGEDVTDQRALEGALREAIEGAKRATAAKSEFLANMSHEIRTPLNAVGGLAYLLSLSGLDPKQREYVKKLAASAEILRHVVDDVLDFSKIESGKVEIDRTTFSVFDLYGRVHGIFGERMAEKGLEMRFLMDEGVGRMLTGDPHRIMQVLTNLVGNAIKFTERGSIVLSSSLATENGKEILRFSVRDTGIGMTPEQVGRVFATFAQADASITRRFGGTGLGLAISKGLVEAMGGSIELSSVAGKGTEFRFSVVVESAPATATATPWDTSRRMRALIVGGIEEERKALGAILRDLVFEAVFVDSAMDAILQVDPSGASGAAGFAIVFVFEPYVGDGAERLAAALRAMLGRAKRNARIVVVLPPGAPVTGENHGRNAADRLLVGPLSRGEVFNQLLLSVTTETKVEPLSGHVLEGVRILVVEDNEINQMVAEEILTLAGAQISIAKSGAEALERLAADPDGFEIVLMDLQMPGMDGYRTARLIRENFSAERLPIVALTAQALASESRRSADAGMNAFLTKPIDPVALIEAINLVRGQRGAGKSTASSSDPPPVDV